MKYKSLITFYIFHYTLKIKYWNGDVYEDFSSHIVLENLQYLSMKESNLFDLFVTWKSPKPSCVLSCFWCRWQVFNE
jgi:hypothetical protein